MEDQSLFRTLSHPARAKIIKLLYENVSLTYDEMLLSLRIGPWQLDSHLKILEGLIEAKNGAYSLTEKGVVAYRVMREVREFDLDREVVVKASLFKRAVATGLDFFFFFSIPALFVNRIEHVLIPIVPVLVIWTLMEARLGKTPGKYVVGTRAIKKKGMKLGLKESLIRNLGKFFLPLDLLLGLFYRKRGYIRFADYRARSVVIDEEVEE